MFSWVIQGAVAKCFGYRNVSSCAGGLFSWVIHLPAIVFLGDTVARRCFLGL